MQLAVRKYLVIVPADVKDGRLLEIVVRIAILTVVLPEINGTVKQVLVGDVIDPKLVEQEASE